MHLEEKKQIKQQPDQPTLEFFFGWFTLRMVTGNTKIWMSSIEHPNVVNHVTQASIPWKEGPYEQEHNVLRDEKSPLHLLSSSRDQ